MSPPTSNDSSAWVCWPVDRTPFPSPRHPRGPRPRAAHRPPIRSHLYRPAMAYEVATGYCWPQSTRAGEQVELRASSPGGRAIAVEVARVGGERTVVLSEPRVEVDEHPTPRDASTHGCGWPAALTIDVEPSWR